MTRINLIPPQALTDQHCFAEWREIKMIPRALNRSLKAIKASADMGNYDRLLDKIPLDFTLNKGHVMFFYNKGEYLLKRYTLLTESLMRRGFNINPQTPLDPEGVYDSLPKFYFWQDYEPTPEALKIIRERLHESFWKQPQWYRYSEPAAFWASESPYGERNVLA